MLRVVVADSSFGPASLPMMLVRTNRNSLGGNSANSQSTWRYLLPCFVICLLALCSILVRFQKKESLLLEVRRLESVRVLLRAEAQAKAEARRSGDARGTARRAVKDSVGGDSQGGGRQQRIAKQWKREKRQ